MMNENKQKLKKISIYKVKAKNKQNIKKKLDQYFRIPRFLFLKT